ncbi:MAG TPA: XrtA system polysaccharide deacetylase [Candidatus Acidoferrales bacterium]|nr:XrtA system polysaccharide deacetylase [Candidatus Acidoferrales bacterium]
MTNALTIDVEDYFHVAAFAGVVRRDHWDSYPRRVERNTGRVLELLSQHGVRATFFVLGWVAEKFPGLVRAIREAGHRVGCHGYAHEMVYRNTPEEFRADIRKAKGLLEDAIGGAVESFRAPSYSITAESLWALEILGAEGFTHDSSIFPIVHDQYGIRAARRFPHTKVLKSGRRIKEFPPSTVRLCGINFPVAGGGYLRLAPYAATSWAIRHINLVERQPAMVYVHPWELDPDQPRIAAPWLSRFRHYQNLESTETKLKKLLERFSFAPMEEVLATYCKEESPATGEPL